MLERPRCVGRWTGLFLLVSQRALAVGPPPTFEVPEGCGNEAEFRRELISLTGNSVDRAWPSTLRIAASTATSGYRLTLELQGGRRELAHADCRVLFRSALVIAAASVGSHRGATEVEPHDPPPPSLERAGVAPTVPTPRPPRTKASLPLRGTAALGSGVALGVVPGPTAAFEARLGWMLGRFGASVAGRHYIARHVAVGGRGVEIQGYGLRVAALYRPLSRLALSPGFDADWLVGRGRLGIAVPLEDSAWTLAPSLELAVIPVETRHLSLEVAAAGRLALQRPVFEVTRFGELFQPPAVSLVSVVRGVFHFP